MELKGWRFYFGNNDNYVKFGAREGIPRHMFWTWQCGTTYESEVFSNLHEMLIKFANAIFKSIFLPKKSKKRHQEWAKDICQNMYQYKNCQLPLRPSLCCTLGHFFHSNFMWVVIKVYALGIFPHLSICGCF